MNLAELLTNKHLNVVGIGEMKLSCNPNEVLVTYALGSCIALALYDPVSKMGGLIHCKLPRKGDFTPRAGISNNAYVDTGVYGMLQSLKKYGANQSRLIAKLAGAAGMLDDGGFFQIGRQNYEAMSEVLNALSILPQSIQVGGKQPRTLYLFLQDGTTIIRTPNNLYEI